MPGFWDIFRNRHKEETVAEHSLWDNFEVKGVNSGSDVFVKGDHFDMYANDRLHADELQHFSYPEHKFIDISPASIEGIHLGKGEAEDPSVFWSQHAQGWGTSESFKQIASHIPEVRQRLDAGESLASIQEDPDIGECASIYFANKPKVYECDGHYEFDSNGRHRILAARDLGYDIPVEVIGYYGRNEPDISETPAQSSVFSDSTSLDAKSARAKAVEGAWEREKELVQNGQGTRDWSVTQQAELDEYGKVTGFEGSHMMNVHDYPEYEGNPDNIQLMPSVAHFEGVHEHNPRVVNPNGRFDENTGEVIPSMDGQIPEQPIIPLTDKYNSSQKEYHQSTPEMEQSGMRRHDDYYQSKENHPEKSQKIGFRAASDDAASESQTDSPVTTAAYNEGATPEHGTQEGLRYVAPVQEAGETAATPQRETESEQEQNGFSWNNVRSGNDQSSSPSRGIDRSESETADKSLNGDERYSNNTPEPQQDKAPEQAQNGFDWGNVRSGNDQSSDQSNSQSQGEKNGISM